MDFVVHSPSLHYSESRKLVEILVRDTVVALIANSKSRESFYLRKITDKKKNKMEDVEDGFGHFMKKGMKHLEGVFLKRRFDSDNLYTISKKPF